MTAIGFGQHDALERALLHRVRAGCVDFADLVRHSDGAYPGEIAATLQRLALAGEIPKIDWMATSDTVASETRPPSVLPEPHPADYDWRFTVSTATHLASLASRLAQGRPIGLFGVPTVFVELVSLHHDQVLYDRNVSLIGALQAQGLRRAVNVDLFRPVPSLPRSLALVIADPPWYPEYYNAFIQRAAEALVPEGILLLSMLPRLTRPTAIEERGQILQFASASGFDLGSLRKSMLRYQTPPFEAASLIQAGLPVWNWRRGDLAVFRYSPAPARVGDLADDLVSDDWETFEVLGRQIKVRRRAAGLPGLPFEVRPLGGVNGVLTTVSRRLPIRESIDVWTSQNQAWQASDAGLVRKAIAALAEGQDPTAAATGALGATATPSDLDALEGFLRHLLGSFKDSENA